MYANYERKFYFCKLVSKKEILLVFYIFLYIIFTLTEQKSEFAWIDSSIKYDWNKEIRGSDITFKHRQFCFTPASILSTEQQR